MSDADSKLGAPVVRPESDEHSSVNDAFLPAFAIPPWPEWSDEEINNDTWEDMRFVQEGYFRDPLGTILPPNIPVIDWVRPADLFLEPMLLNPQESEIDLITPNFHICETSTIIRTILSEISELYELALQRDFFCDGEGYDYVPNSEHPWKPWDHIYSLNQAGVLGSKPRINPKGRYVVRLYFMGSWRRITVDDRIPLVKYGLFGLPVSHSLELWPLILTKAILKVALATTGFQSDPELRRFSTIACLTGWIHEWHQVPQPVTTDELWQYLNEVLPKYKRPRPQRKKLLRDFEFETDSLFLLQAPKGSGDANKTKEKSPDQAEGQSGKGKGKKDKKGKKGKKDKQSDTEGATTDTESVKSKGKGKKDKKGKQVTISDSEQTEDDGQSTARTEKKDTDANDAASSKKGKGGKKSKKGKSTDDESSDAGKKGKKSKKDKADKKDDKSGTSPRKTLKSASSELRKIPECAPGILPEVKLNQAGVAVPTCKAVPLPSIEAICMGVKKHLGPLQHGAMVDLEKKIGRDIPFALSASFFEFPRDDHGQPLRIPSYLHKHPVYLAQVRDCPIRKHDSCRPPTPLWKTFRWKRWAMKKGIIPKDETFDGKEIRSILSKTPFTLSTKWMDVMGPGFVFDDQEEEVEARGAQAEFLHPHLVGPIELPIMFKIPPLAMYGDLPKIINTAQTPAPTALVPLPPFKKGKGGSDSGSKKSDKGGKGKKGKKDKKEGDDKSEKSDEEGGKKGGGKKDKKEKKGKGEKEEKKKEGKKEKKSKSKESGKSDSGSEKGGKGKKGGKKKKGEENVKFSPEVPKPQEAIPQKACGEMWIDVQDVGHQLASITKFYSTKNNHGCFYVLRRLPKRQAPVQGILKGNTDPASRWETPNSVPGSGRNQRLSWHPSAIPEKKHQPRHVSLDIAPWQMNNIDDLDAGFYLFSDCWTMQELLITLEVLNDNHVTSYVSSIGENNESTALGEMRARPVTVILKPWDWRRECSMDGNVIVISTTTSCSIHLPLPPGRNLFRIWLLDEPSVAGDKCFRGGGDAGPYRSAPEPHFSVKILSQTQVLIGSREHIQDMMAGETALFIRQADILARSVWALLLSFGKVTPIQWKSLIQLRRSYCPTPSVRNPINDILRQTHDKFDAIFLSWVVGANGGKLHKWALLTARTLLLNPTLGSGEYDPADYPVDDADINMAEQRKLVQENSMLIRCHLLSRYCIEVWECVALVIQRYWRGWLTRRLFHVRKSKHKNHIKVDTEIRRIALYLAQAITHNFQPITDPEEYSKLRDTASLILTVPNWACETLHQLLQSDPWLISVMPHAYSFPFHVRITDVAGLMPADDTSQWIPFYRHHLHNSPDDSAPHWRFYQFDLQAYPNEELRVAIIDNETSLPVDMPHPHMYVGKLPVAEAGYTILLYTLKTAEKYVRQEGRELTNAWKLRILQPEGPAAEKIILFDKKKDGEDVEPSSLKLTRFTGFYIPNDDFCVCRYTLEVNEPTTTISVRFTTSFEDVDLKVQIWDLNTRRLLLQRHGRGTLFLPSVVLQREISDSASVMNDSSLNVDEEEFGGEAEAGEENEENFTLTEPEAKRRSKNTQRYAIGIFVEGNSWPLTDKEWDFVQMQTKKFWKKMLVFRAEAAEHDRMLAQARDQKRSSKAPEAEELLVDDDERDPNRKSAASRKSEVWKEGESKKDGKGSKRQLPLTAPKSKTKRKKKRKSRKSLSAGKSDLLLDGDKDDDDDAPGGLLTMSDLLNVPLDSFDQIKSVTDYGAIDDSGVETKTDEEGRSASNERKSTTPGPSSSENARGSEARLGDLEEEMEGTEDAFHQFEKISENLTIVEGGPDSEFIFDETQPHWKLEVVTDKESNVEFKSNRRAFQERLIATKLQWEKNQPGRYKNGRVARHEFLARNLRPIEPDNPNPYSVVAYTNRFYSCMYYDEDQLDGFNSIDWPDLTKKSEPETPPETQLAIESFDPHPEDEYEMSEPISARRSTISTLASSKGTTVGQARKSIVTIETTNTTEHETMRVTGGKRKTVKLARRSIKPRRKSMKGSEFDDSEPFEAPKTEEETTEITEDDVTNAVTMTTGNDETEFDATLSDYDGEMHPETVEELVSAQDQPRQVPSKVPSTMWDMDRRFCAPPRRGPTHILLGPELEKCGILPKAQLVGSDNQALNDMYGMPARNKITLAAQRRETKRRFEAFRAEYTQRRDDFREELEGNVYRWLRFREDLHTDVFCELEANRYFLEQFREVYNEKFALKSPGRSSIDFNLRSMSEIREMVRRLSDATTISTKTDRTSIATSTGTLDALLFSPKKKKGSKAGDSSDASSKKGKKAKRSKE